MIIFRFKEKSKLRTDFANHPLLSLMLINHKPELNSNEVGKINGQLILKDQ